ncbi:MAG: nucleotidyltransferase domain-containing protein [Erysipelotrichaceae bacterium]|nr:nucleotidyltransferase domain-containing protein [Erysipelotrichaceae bacterium]
MTELKKLRLQKKLTQQETAKRIGISLRSYIMYENDQERENTPKYRFLIQELAKLNLVDESHGILAIDDIKNICAEVFAAYPVDFCYLFGSYAKGKAKEVSDVDLLVAADITGLRFYGMAELLREGLHKKVDLLDIKQLVNNEELIREVLKGGIKIYG